LARSCWSAVSAEIFGLLVTSRPLPVTYYVVVSFSRDDAGNVVPLEPVEAPNAEAAKRRAWCAAEKHAGAVAFSRTGDPGTGEFQDAEIIATFGEVNVDVLAV